MSYHGKNFDVGMQTYDISGLPQNNLNMLVAHDTPMRGYIMVSNQHQECTASSH